MSDWTREEQKKHSAEWTRQYEKGQRDAEERIIKLLEDAIDHDWKGSEPCEACDQTDYLIALIKGENGKREAIRELKRLSREIGEVD